MTFSFLSHRFKVSLLVTAVGCLSFSSLSHAELSINPYPLSGGTGFDSEVSHSSRSQASQEVVHFDSYQEPNLVMEPDPVYVQPAEMSYDGIPSSSPVDLVPSVQPAGGEWSTFRGADLHEVLEAWSQAHGIDLIWSVSDGYSVRETVTFNDSYENAVSGLLGQYDDLYVRPVASLHVSPDGHSQTLVVFSYEGS